MIVVLCFDVDGVSAALNTDPASWRLPSLMSMLNYGPSVGTPRILNILDEMDIKASFYVPGYIAETHQNLVKDIKARGHEIGHHGYMHEPPHTLSPPEEIAVLDKGIAILCQITGEKPRGYRSPGWELSQQSISFLADRDFLYDSSLMDDDGPYIITTGNRYIVEIPVQWGLDDYPFFHYAPTLGTNRPIATTEQVLQEWCSAFKAHHKLERVFVLTLHPYIIGRPGRLQMLSQLIQYMRGFSGVRFMTSAQLAEAVIDQANPIG
jgi:peptidoglycan/xylan/chitin deacetylase (PgdA/CDA1 family)